MGMGSGICRSPEMVTFKDYNTATDIFSFGCIMYELFARTLRSAHLCAGNPGPSAVISYAEKVVICPFAPAPKT